MTPWMDALYKLQSLGYSFSVNREKLKYAYRGMGDPLRGEITPLLEALKTHKGEILGDPGFLIEQTLREIDKTWQPGSLRKMKRTLPKEFEKMRAIEEGINRLVLSGDLEGLKKALFNYKKLILGVQP